jgi:hypothetical protein
MNVVPDVLPALRPSLDLRVSFPRYNPSYDYATYQTVEPGVYLTPKDVGFLLQWCLRAADTVVPRRCRSRGCMLPSSTPSQGYIRCSWLTQVGLALFLLSKHAHSHPDVPDPETQTYSTHLHWLQYVYLIW